MSKGIKMASKAALFVKMREVIDSLDSLEEDLVNKAIDTLPEKFRDDFRKFADHGEIGDIESVAYWGSDESCQKVLRELMQRRINGLEKIISIMKELVA